MDRSASSPEASVVVLLASSRSKGDTFSLARRVLSEEVPLVDLGSLKIGYYAYDGTNAGDDFLALIERLVDVPVRVLATPLYWYTMSAQAKTFIDRLSDLLTTHEELGRRLRGKALAVVCAGSDPQLPGAFAQPLELTCAYLGMRFLGVHYASFVGQTLRDDATQRAAEVFRDRVLGAATTGTRP
jgi:putative NADPH-quinone reductase